MLAGAGHPAMAAGVARDSKPARFFASALGGAMLSVFLAAGTFAGTQRAAAPLLNISGAADFHSQLLGEAAKAMSLSEGWRRPTTKTSGVTVAALAAEAAPAGGARIHLPEAMLSCAGGSSSGGASTSAGGAPARAPFSRCTAPGCIWKTRAGEVGVDRHWAVKPHIDF